MFGVAICGAISTRVLLLGERSITFDEGYSYALAERDLPGMFRLFQVEANGLFYPLLLWPTTRLSDSVEALRSPALVAGIASIPILYIVGRQYVGANASAIGTVVFSLSSAAIAFSQEARAYSFAILFTISSYGFLSRATKSPRQWRWWLLYSVAMTAIAYSSSIIFLTSVVAHAIVILQRGREVAARWVVAGAVITVAVFPLLLLLTAEAGVRDALYYLDEPGFRDVVSAFAFIAAGPESATDRGLLLAFAISAVVCLTFGAALRKTRYRALYAEGVNPGSLATLIGWALIPPAMVFLISQLHPVFNAKYFIGSLPALCLLIGTALSVAPRRAALILGAMLFVLLSATIVLTNPHTTDYRTVSAWLKRERDLSRDNVLLIPLEQLPALAYYLEEFRSRGLTPVEEWGDTPLPPRIHGYRLPGGYGQAPEAPPKVSEIASLATEGGRGLVIVSYPGWIGNEVDRWRLAHCRTSMRVLGRLALVELDDCSDTGS